MTPDESPCRDSRGAEQTASKRRFRAPRVGGLLATSGALVVGVSVAVLSAGVSFAYLNAGANAGEAATVTTGTADLRLQYGSDAAAQTITIPAAAYQKMLPGDVVGVQVNIINVGVVPQTVAASVSATGAWETRIAAGACPATVLGTAALTTTDAGSIPLAVGATQPVCVQVTLPLTAAAVSENSTFTYTVNFAGTQSAS